MNTRKVIAFVAGQRMELLLTVLTVILILVLASSDGEKVNPVENPTLTNTPTWMAWLTSTFTSTSTATSTATPPVTFTPTYAIGTDLFFSALPYPLMRMPSGWTVSEEGVRFAAFWEGYVGTPYDDGGPGVGNCTIGYGWLIHIGPCNGSESITSISESAARAKLRNDLNHCGMYVQKYVTVPISQNQYDILSGLVCGWGYGKFSQSEVLSLLNQRQYVAAAARLRTTAIYGIGIGYCPGLARRRQVEAEKFLTIYEPVWPFIEHPLETPTPKW